ncbi:MAG: hypothetical protein WA405_02560 [Candidatus Acidiferrales bacterium]
MGELESLALAKFGKLRPAEEELVRAAPTGEGAVCGPNVQWADPAYDPSKAEGWGTDREIRAELIRWLCVDRRAKELVDPKGIQVVGAKISDSLDLDNVTIPFCLSLQRCRLMKDLNLLGAQMPTLDLQGTQTLAIVADRVIVKGSIFLRDGFHAEGGVRFMGAQIGGNLDCSGATFQNPAQAGATGSGYALNADGAVIKGSVFLNNIVNAEGNVEVPFSAKGGVRFLGAQIGGALNCGGATFENPALAKVSGSGNALLADRAVVKGSVFFNKGFNAKGEVRFVSSQIEGNLACVDAKISGTLIAQTAVIKGGFFWVGIDPKETALNLRNASVSALVDDVGSWPATGKLALDGFVYERISEGPRDAKSRLRWLARQRQFAPQPYRQLAKVLRDEGDDAGARKVLHEMELRRRRKEDESGFDRFWSTVLRLTIGYGYYPGRALSWLLVIVLVGWPLFWHGYFAWSMTPTQEDAYYFFENRHGSPGHYERFCALTYSLEKTFPLIKLGQVDLWQPDPNPPPPNPATASSSNSSVPWFISAEFLRCFGWCQTVLGWILATLFAAGVTGVVRND